MNWKQSKIESLFKTKHEAYDGGIDRAILLISLHAAEHGPTEVIELIKCLKTGAKNMEG